MVVTEKAADGAKGDSLSKTEADPCNSVSSNPADSNNIPIIVTESDKTESKDDDNDDSKGISSSGIVPAAASSRSFFVKKKKVLTFPKFEVFAVTMTSSASLSSPGLSKPRRSSGSSYGDPTRAPEMSPETTLVEFISTSAGFHGVKKQEIKQLEWDILKVFTNNVMPANAAAWYMAKRRFYINNTWENQLLPFLLKKYPDKFYVRNQSVEFLDKYSKDVARKKLNYMVNQGLYAYFSHKADEYGVYFFDPYYYENTEPFHANLRIATNIHRGQLNKLIPSFFAQYKKQIVFSQHSPYLVTIAKTQTKIKVNTTGIIVKMIDKTFGLIQFPSGSGTEKALFTTKSLFTNGWPYQGDPLRLDAVQFDGYKISGPIPERLEYTWYAVLVWGGRKPSPKFCATKDDLTPRFLKRQQQQEVDGPQPAAPQSMPNSTEEKSPKPFNFDDAMIIGEVLEIRKNGAVVSMQSKDIDEKAIIPGWRKENLRRKGFFLTTTQGVGLAIKDLIGYYLDPNTKVPPYTYVGHQVIVLKHTEEPAQPPLVPQIQQPKIMGMEIGTSGSPNTRNGIRQLARAAEFSGMNETNAWKMLKKLDPYTDENEDEDDDSYAPDDFDNFVDSSDYSSFDEADEISDGELNFLREGIRDLISLEIERAPDCSSIAFLQKVMEGTNNAISLRRRTSKGQRPVTPSSHDSGNPTSREVTPTERTRYNSRSGMTRGSQGSDKPFWRMKKAFKCLETYNSDEDPSYEPSENSEGWDTETDEKDDDDRDRKRNRRNERRTRQKNFKRKEMNTRIQSNDYAYWTGCILGPGIVYCDHSKKWIPNANVSSDDEEDDPDYRCPKSDIETDTEDSDLEIDKEEIKALEDDLKEEPRKIPDQENDQLDGGESEVQPKKKKRPKIVPYWLSYLLGIPKKGAYDVKKASEDSAEKKTSESSSPEEADGAVNSSSLDYYDSGIDGEYVPVPVIYDADCDYDEYSDAEISDNEVKMLISEQDLSLDENLVGPCSCGKVVKKREEEVDLVEGEKSSADQEKQIPISEEDVNSSEEYTKDEDSSQDKNSEILNENLEIDSPQDENLEDILNKAVIELQQSATKVSEILEEPPKAIAKPFEVERKGMSEKLEAAHPEEKLEELEIALVTKPEVEVKKAKEEPTSILDTPSDVSEKNIESKAVSNVESLNEEAIVGETCGYGNEPKLEIASDGESKLVEEANAETAKHDIEVKPESSAPDVISKSLKGESKSEPTYESESKVQDELEAKLEVASINPEKIVPTTKSETSQRQETGSDEVDKTEYKVASEIITEDEKPETITLDAAPPVASGSKIDADIQTKEPEGKSESVFEKTEEKIDVKAEESGIKIEDEAKPSAKIKSKKNESDVNLESEPKKIEKRRDSTTKNPEPPRESKAAAAAERKVESESKKVTATDSNKTVKAKPTVKKEDEKPEAEKKVMDKSKKRKVKQSFP